MNLVVPSIGKQQNSNGTKFLKNEQFNSAIKSGKNSILHNKFKQILL